MLKLGPSVIISHGMLDYLTFKKPDDIINYIILVVINYYMFAINNNMIFMFLFDGNLYTISNNHVWQNIWFMCPLFIVNR